MRDLIKEPVRTLFLGTGWESVATLKALHEDPRFDIVGTITTPDKLVGRKQISTPSEVKEYSLKKCTLIHLYLGYSKNSFGIISPNALHTTNSGLNLSKAF